MLRVLEVADRLGCSVRTVRRRIADGTLPSVKVGALRLVPEEALDRIIRTSVFAGLTHQNTVIAAPGHHPETVEIPPLVDTSIDLKTFVISDIWRVVGKAVGQKSFHVFCVSFPECHPLSCAVTAPKGQKDEA
jgi:excisionase family DNA binding protein